MLRGGLAGEESPDELPKAGQRFALRKRMVILESIPFDEQEVPGTMLEAARQPHTPTTRRRANQCSGCRKLPFEFFFMAARDWQLRPLNVILSLRRIRTPTQSTRERILRRASSG